jgi:hypothetical protein
MVRSKASWVSIISELCCVVPDKCTGVIDDLTFVLGRSLDLHVYPFVPLQDSSGPVLAVAPQFPLHSRPDENILRVVSTLRSGIFNQTSNEKEGEALADLATRLPNRKLLGPIMMPKPVPDIDLLIADEPSSTVVLAELKWMRKSLRSIEIPDKDARFSTGSPSFRRFEHILPITLIT